MTGTPATLRWRVTLAYTGLGALLSVLFACATVLITEDYERVIVDEILRGQAEDYGVRLTSDPGAALPRTHRLSGYLRRAGTQGGVPSDLQSLSPGIHEGHREEGVDVGVFDTAAGRLYFVIDLRDIEALERHLAHFLLAVIVFGTALAGWLGWLLSGATLAPVMRLAAAVDALPAYPHRTALAASSADDELGRLAHAIDDLQARLVDALAAERAFFADASHELRTPMAVVQGVAEVLLDEKAEDDPAYPRLLRLERGMEALTDLLDVLLGLVRHRIQRAEDVDAADLLQRCRQSLPIAGSGAIYNVSLEAAGRLHVPVREALLVLRCLIRRLVPQEGARELRLRALGMRLEIEVLAPVGVSMPHVAPDGERSDDGLGLTLVGRLAQQLGWRIELVHCDAERCAVHVHLPPGALTT